MTWLAFWNDPINPKEFKYVFLAASSTLKGLSDKEKYEKARLLKVLGIDILLELLMPFISIIIIRRARVILMEINCYLNAGLHTRN